MSNDDATLLPHLHVHVWDINAAFDHSAASPNRHQHCLRSTNNKENRIPQESPLVPLQLPLSRSNKNKNKNKNRKEDENTCSTTNNVHGGSLNIDAEIQRVEQEIQRLSRRLQELRIIKKETEQGRDDKHGRIVPAKFMEPTKKDYINALSTNRRNEDASPSITVARARQRRLSLGPLEMTRTTKTPSKPNLNLDSGHQQQHQQQGATRNDDDNNNKKKKKGKEEVNEQSTPAARLVAGRRGFSLGPLEIHRQNLQCHNSDTALTSFQRPRKSVSRKLNVIQEGEEKQQPPPRSWKSQPSIASRASLQSNPTKYNKLQERMVTRRGRGGKRRSASTSPKPRRQPSAANNVSRLRGGIATVGAQKAAAKREDGPSSALRPKALFHDPRNAAVDGRRPAKVRAVASRYSLAPARSSARDEPQGKRRKCSLPELANDGPALSAGGSHGSTSDDCTGKQGVDMKPEEAMESPTDFQSPQSIIKIAELLPRVRTLRCTAESPRDSGCAKRVADLVGKRSFFVTAIAGEYGISSYQDRTLEEAAES